MNTPLLPDPGSLRDPANRVFVEEGRVLRAVMAPGAAAYRAARDAGLYEALADKGLLLPAREILPDDDIGTLPGALHTLEHPVIPFISYPYEWSFAVHRAAALLHLNLHLAALEAGFTLSDSTAYNVQFRGTQPVFIDHLSLQPYRDGEIWAGHRQFCMQFLNPLLFWSRLGVAPNAWFRGALEGVEPEAMAALLPLRAKLSWTVMTHVTAQAALGRRPARNDGNAGAARTVRLPKVALVGMLTGLKRFIERLPPPRTRTVWADYAQATSYTADEAAAKRAFVRDMTTATRPRLLLDLGCNTGDYSEVVLESGETQVVGFDFDHGALDQAYHRFHGRGRSFLPIWMDAANPSPSQGWAQGERKGLRERAKADALIALALIHHIAIGRNVPLDMAVEWIVGMAPTGIIEFPSKADPMVQRLLSHRTDIFPDYTEETFLTAVRARARVERQTRVSANGRLLVWYDRTNHGRLAETTLPRM